MLEKLRENKKASEEGAASGGAVSFVCTIGLKFMGQQTECQID